MLFPELSDVEKLVFLKLYLNILTLKLLFMSDVEKEETKWPKYF